MDDSLDELARGIVVYVTIIAALILFAVAALG